MDFRVDFECISCFILAALCLILPMDWLFAAMMAALCHELCHILAVFLMGGRIYSLSIGVHGAVMESSSMSLWQELICILAGPAGSFLLLLLDDYIPKTALCGLIQGLFNLLPLYPLDGGRALYCVCRIFVSERRADRFCGIARKCVLIFVFCGSGFCCLFRKKGIFPIFLALFLLSRTGCGKISCKEGNLRVQ